MAAAKIAITIDEELLREVEAVQRRTQESRSAVIARAIARFVQAEELRRDVERYKQAYKEQPETTRDVRLARALTRKALSGVRGHPLVGSDARQAPRA